MLEIKNTMMKNTIILMAGLLLFTCSQALSQNKKGTVVTFKGFKLNNVEVYAKKSKETVHTDTTGSFIIKTNGKDALRFKAEGFYPITVKLKENETVVKVNLVYMETPKAYRDAVDNNHISKVTLDHCIAELLDDNNNYDRMNSIYQIIQKEHASAKVVSIDGVNKVVLNSRGPNTMHSGQEALLVVDGIVTDDISSVNPEQVRSVKVFIGNDAAHWGTRGGNGVVEITLKSGI